MFASLKNKIREETGNDLSKLTAKITSSTVQKFDSLRGKSFQGSHSSINSILSSDDLKDGTIDIEDVKKRVSRIEADFKRRLDQKEKEWSEIINAKDKQLEILEKEKEEAYKQIANLRDKLKITEDFKQKLVEHQEDKEQIENFQSQELSKIKHLVLLRDKELAEKNASLKEAQLQLEKMRSEMARLRRQEEHLSDVQDDLDALRHSTSRDMASLASNLTASEEERKHLKDLIVILKQRLANETSADEQLISERKLLEQRLEEAHVHLADIKTSWSDKITSLETQVGRLSRQAAEEGTERRRALQEKELLFEKVQQLEAELEYNKLDLNNKNSKILRLNADLEELSAELKRVRAENEEHVSFLRTQLINSNTEVTVVKKNLENSETKVEKIEEDFLKLRKTIDVEHELNISLNEKISKLEGELQEEKFNSLNVQKTLSRVTSEKNAALVRNAEISQQIELIKQEKRRQDAEFNELSNKMNQLEEEYSKNKESEALEKQLRNQINDLEEQISDKNKNIKTLTLRLADMKKTLQQELRTPTNHNYFTDDTNTAAILTPTQSSVRNHSHNIKRDEEDVNFKYLKHVVIKFLTSKDYEAQHLTKAISTVLKFTPEEEKLINDTIEWRRSWFGSRPKLLHKSKPMS
ncbi:golgin subfamily A member 1 isoform X2 [Harmonia axyridis]|uniref:golgin subfamily A member 1 isoform X2 n=1 Tax=Harmonia axyridis TaxID=115357 RepID=UPI001E2794DC|nr:golgin subfamily A member 1 isoform X2 [Harmonia axyridis]